MMTPAEVVAAIHALDLPPDGAVLWFSLWPVGSVVEVLAEAERRGGRYLVLRVPNVLSLPVAIRFRAGLAGMQFEADGDLEPDGELLLVLSERCLVDDDEGEQPDCWETLTLGSDVEHVLRDALPAGVVLGERYEPPPRRRGRRVRRTPPG